MDLRTATYVSVEELDGTRQRVSKPWPYFCRTGADAVRFPTRKYLYRCTVYNLEVEDYHTYHVGQHGVWVHNKGDGHILPIRPSVVLDMKCSTRSGEPRLLGKWIAK